MKLKSFEGKQKNIRFVERKNIILEVALSVFKSLFKIITQVIYETADDVEIRRLTIL